MTQQEITGNKIIAEFMNKELFDKWILQDGELPNGLQYQASWDLLMPVWKKCFTIQLWMITNGHDRLYLEKSREIERAIVNEVNCRKASLLISQMIEWYNENKPSTLS